MPLTLAARFEEGIELKMNGYYGPIGQ